MELLTINGHDYSPFVERKGYGWSRNDLDSDKTTRTKDGKMRRHKIAAKRKLSYTMMNMTRSQLAQLDDDLSKATFSARYLDMYGEQTREFYCSSFSASVSDIHGGADMWEGAAFTLIEV